MRGRGKTILRAAVIVWLTATVAAGPAYAQSQSQGESLKDWSLPAPQASQSPTAQGPVDAQNPLVHTVNPNLPNPETPTPLPTISAPPPPPAASTAPATVPSARPAATATRAPAPSAGASSPAAPGPSPSADAAAPTLPSPAPPATPEAQTAPAPAPAASSGWPLWLWAIPAVLAILASGLLLSRRRAARHEEEQAYAPAEPLQKPAPPAPEIAATPIPAPAPVPASGLASPPPPAREPVRAGGEFEFVPIAMRLSLVYATLQFRVVLTAQTEIPAGKLLGDMISAHGSLPQSLQLAPPPEAMRTVKAIPHLAPGETVELKGELQLPLNAIRPVHQGGASFMVPLVRLALVGDGEPGLPHLELGFVFTVGLPGTGTGVAPLRLDTGPREFAELAGREIEAARRTVLLPLDPARAAG